jgi:hypothetical protein
MLRLAWPRSVLLDRIRIRMTMIWSPWKSSCTVEYRELNAPTDVVNTVTERLGLGLVPPVFHAYAALFKPKGGTKNLIQDGMASAKQNEMIAYVLESPPSMNPVTKGSAAASQPGRVGDQDFMNAFFTKYGLTRNEVRVENNLVWTFSLPDGPKKCAT